MIERAKLEDNYETWTAFQQYRQNFRTRVIDEQVILAQKGISWEASGKMQVLERRYVLEKILSSQHNG